MATYIGLIVVGTLIRQADRLWFATCHEGRPVDGLRAVMEMQRRRLNDITPVLLLLGHWIEIIGWCLLAVHAGPWGWASAAALGAVKMRHLQEVSHFAVHGVLTRSRALSAVLTEASVHLPLGFVPVRVRWQRHVRDHHPNATLSGMDPNLGDLERAGLRPGVSPGEFLRAVAFPLTPGGVADTVAATHDNFRTSVHRWWRAAAFCAVPVALWLLLGWQAAVFVFLVPRLLLYPQLAWMSLLVEHRWFDAEELAGSRAAVEAARCLRLYPRNAVLAALARATWLPYGDLFHFAHSAHPAVRWNYLPALDRALGTPSYAPDGLLFGGTAVIRHHRQALATASTVPAPESR